MRFRFNNYALMVILSLMSSCLESDIGAQNGTAGIGGSLARFAINGQRMYVATSNTLNVFDISSNNFKELNKIDVGFGLETIFAKGEYLYLGSRDAMFIFSISNPDLPSLLFRYAHITSCDPVVVQGNKAYVALSSGSTCNLGTNALEIIDITDPLNPSLIANFPMTSPGGLGIDGNCLFVCEGVNGLKMLNVENPLDIKLVNEITNINAYDVIVGDGYLKLTGQDGIMQYSYSCSSMEMTLLSKIPVERETY